MNKNDKNIIYVYLSEEVTHSPDFSNYAIATYSIIQTIYTRSLIKQHFITPQQIEFYLTGNLYQSRRFTDNIKSGIEELIKKNVLAKIEETPRGFIIDCSSLWVNPEDDKYTIIHFQEIQKIFGMESVNSFHLLRYFIFLIGSINKKIGVSLNEHDYMSRVVGTLPISYISKISGMSEHTIMEYNRILEKNGLLYIRRENGFVIDKENNDIRHFTNVYGRPCDKLYIDTFAKQRIKNCPDYISQQDNNANHKRRLAQIYNRICKGFDSNYSENEILEVYHYILTENEKYRRLYEDSNLESYLEKIRSVDVFTKYNLTDDIDAHPDQRN